MTPSRKQQVWSSHVCLPLRHPTHVEGWYDLTHCPENSHTQMANEGKDIYHDCYWSNCTKIIPRTSLENDPRNWPYHKLQKSNLCWHINVVHWIPSPRRIWQSPLQTSPIHAQSFCWTLVGPESRRHDQFSSSIDPGSYFSPYRWSHKARSSLRCREKREKIKNLITPKSFIAHLSLWSRLMWIANSWVSNLDRMRKY